MSKYSLRQLKQIADKLDIKYSPNIGETKLTEKIESKADDFSTTIDEVADDLGLIPITASRKPVTVPGYEGISKQPDLSISGSTSPTDPSPSKFEEAVNRGCEDGQLKLAVDTVNKTLDKQMKEEIERLKKLTFDKADKTYAKKHELDQVKDANKLIRVTVSTNNPNKKNWIGEIFCARNDMCQEVKKMVPFNVIHHVPLIILNMMKEKKCQLFKTVKTTNGVPHVVRYEVAEYNIQEHPPITRAELEAIKKKQLAEGYKGGEEA